MYKLNINIF